jgi:hypothetical protein
MYLPREPHETVLYRLVKEHGTEFLRHARESYDGPLPPRSRSRLALPFTSGRARGARVRRALGQLRHRMHERVRRGDVRGRGLRHRSGLRLQRMHAHRGLHVPQLLEQRRLGLLGLCARLHIAGKHLRDHDRAGLPQSRQRQRQRLLRNCGRPLRRRHGQRRRAFCGIGKRSCSTPPPSSSTEK